MPQVLISLAKVGALLSFKLATHTLHYLGKSAVSLAALSVR
jgi:hypothetical protein